LTIDGNGNNNLDMISFILKSFKFSLIFSLLSWSIFFSYNFIKSFGHKEGSLIVKICPLIQTHSNEEFDVKSVFLSLKKNFKSQNIAINMKFSKNGPDNQKDDDLNYYTAVGIGMDKSDPADIVIWGYRRGDVNTYYLTLCQDLSPLDINGQKIAPIHSYYEQELKFQTTRFRNIKDIEYLLKGLVYYKGKNWDESVDAFNNVSLPIGIFYKGISVFSKYSGHLKAQSSHFNEDISSEPSDRKVEQGSVADRVNESVFISKQSSQSSLSNSLEKERSQINFGDRSEENGSVKTQMTSLVQGIFIQQIKNKFQSEQNQSGLGNMEADQENKNDRNLRTFNQMTNEGLGDFSTFNLEGSNTSDNDADSSFLLNILSSIPGLSEKIQPLLSMLLPGLETTKKDGDGNSSVNTSEILQVLQQMMSSGVLSSVGGGGSSSGQLDMINSVTKMMGLPAVDESKIQAILKDLPDIGKNGIDSTAIMDVVKKHSNGSSLSIENTSDLEKIMQDMLNQN
jgi:hypothetical protein